MDSAFLQKKFLSFLKRNGHDFSYENVNVFGNESDILSLCGGRIHEYEFKVGESDFRKDIKKNRHKGANPHYFYYVVSSRDVIKGKYLDYAGIYVHRFTSDGCSIFKLIKTPTLIRHYPVETEELYTLLKKIYGKRSSIPVLSR